jgi:hypothetical protein
MPPPPLLLLSAVFIYLFHGEHGRPFDYYKGGLLSIMDCTHRPRTWTRLQPFSPSFSFCYSISRWAPTAARWPTSPPSGCHFLTGKFQLYFFLIYFFLKK